jgi:N6-adenosine-specific RNA methylase IME4
MIVKDLTKTNNKYQVIYTDCPWHYRGQVQRGGASQTFSSSADSYYATLTIYELCAMGSVIKRLADPEGCALYMWYSPPILEDAMKLMKAWGFRYATCAFVWDKQRVNPGHYTMSQCEMVNVGTLRRVPKPRGSRNVRQLISEPRTSHSAKPLEVRQRITEMHPLQKKIELFSRFSENKDSNWDDWGMDIGSVPWIP